MEKKKEYELSEIILGTRKLYQGYQKDLNLLKKLSTPTKKNVQDFYFYVYQDNGINPQLYCKYAKSQNALQKVILKVKDFAVGVFPDENIGQCIKDENGFYAISGTYRKNFPVEIKSPITFGRIATEVLDSEFIQRIKLEKEKTQHGYISSVDENSFLSLSQSFIQQHSYKNGPGTLYSSVTYYPNKDTILMSFGGKASNEKIEHILKTEYESEKLSKYHIDSITTSEILEKPIVLEKVAPCSMVEYKIVEEENQVVLVKVMGEK